MNIILQCVALVCILGGIYLTAHKKRLSWVVYEIGGVAWVILYARTGLYIAIIAQSIFMIMNIYGWFKWGKK